MVLFYMDAPGIREELRDMARRLASVGWVVLLPYLFHRAGRNMMFSSEVLNRCSAAHTRLRTACSRMTIPPVMDDVVAMIACLATRKSVKHGLIGELG